ncbi:hypothetical protein NCS52_01028800 [Fusarium sp. LHS14.1]|nr:hypothetical protein NCS52_01028800 [Fusarium sp. LHS14.1]
MSCAASVQYLYVIHGLLFRTMPDEPECPELGQLLGNVPGHQITASWVESRVDCILEQCDFEFLTMTLFNENEFWISAIERVAQRWEEAIPPYHFIRLVKAILTARYNHIEARGFRLPDGDVACSADILLFNFLLYSIDHQTVSGIPSVPVPGWDTATIEYRLACSRRHKAQRWARVHGTTLRSDPAVFDELAAMILTRGPPTKTLQSLQEEYEDWLG